MATTKLGKTAEKLIRDLTPENVDQVWAEFDRLIDQAQDDPIATLEIKNAGEALVMYKSSISSKDQ